MSKSEVDSAILTAPSPHGREARALPPKRRPSNRLSAVFTIAGVGALWELVGRLKLIGDGAFPALSGIATHLWRDRADYPPHVAATVRAATIGFTIGVLIAILAGVAF